MFLQTTTFLGGGRVACVAYSVRREGQVQVVLTDYYFSEASLVRLRACSYRLLLFGGRKGPGPTPPPPGGTIVRAPQVLSKSIYLATK